MPLLLTGLPSRAHAEKLDEGFMFNKHHIRGALMALALLAILIPSPSRAENLDDDSIRKFYADSTAILRQPAKIRAFMEERLDDDFTLQENSTEILNGGPSQTNASNSSKAQAIDGAVQGANAMNFETLENKIISIKYSDDHKFAFVTDSTASTGTIKIPAATGAITAHYQDGESCVDRLALAGTLIKMMQSACNDQLVITK